MTPQERAAAYDAAAQAADDRWNRTGDPDDYTPNRCGNCGEAEMVGEVNDDGKAAEFGWFDSGEDGKTYCQRCGAVQR